MKNYVWTISGLDCANCAAKIENAIRETPEITSVNMNFMQKRLKFSSNHAGIEPVIEKVILKIEPDVSIQKDTVHSHEHKNTDLWQTLARIGISALLLVLANVLPISATVQIVFFVLSYLIIGADILWRAARNMVKGALLDENFLMSIATLGAFATKQFSEAVAVMLFYQVGELFQSIAVDRSRRSIKDLMDIRPDFANIQRDGQIIKCNPSEINVGDTIVIRAGERVPLDAEIIDGYSALDTSALTGESIPRSVNVGDTIMSGCVNLSGVLTAKVLRPFAESTASKILDLVENATEKKTKSENFITKFARYYTPIVVISALLLAIIPPLFFSGIWSDWVYRALVFLVISCPCALVISVPLTFFCGIGSASKRGVLVKGSNYLDALSKVTTVVFDKTGTLTQGVFKVTQIHAVDVAESELLEIAALAESQSTHPIAASIRTAYGKDIAQNRVSDIQEIAGHGISAVVDGHKILIGNAKLMEREEISYSLPDGIGTVLLIVQDGKFIGSILIADECKPDAKQTIAELRKNGVSQTVMLTGDSSKIANRMAKELLLDKVYAELLPSDKVSHIESLLPQGTLAFVGDGMNDAPSLARADIGVAMGGLGSDAAIEAADIVLMTDEPSRLVTALKISRKTLRIVKQNIVFSLIIKLLFLVLGAFGIAGMWEAVFADVGVSVLAIINAIRAMKV